MAIVCNAILLALILFWNGSLQHTPKSHITLPAIYCCKLLCYFSNLLVALTCIYFAGMLRMAFYFSFCYCNAVGKFSLAVSLPSEVIQDFSRISVPASLTSLSAIMSYKHSDGIFHAILSV